MSKIYASIDNSDSPYRLSEGADVYAFDSEQEAKSWLLSFYDKSEWNHESAVFIEAGFGDCWIKVFSEPKEHHKYMAPFEFDDLIIQSPGSHPGGNRYWITPRPPVMIIAEIQEVTIK